MHVHKILAEFSEEIRFFEQLITEADVRIENPLTSHEDRYILHAKRYGWIQSYKTALQLLVDVCVKIQDDFKKSTNLRYIKVYRYERETLKSLKEVYLRLNS